MSAQDKPVWRPPVSARTGPLGDERHQRGPELSPTRSVLLASALVRITAAAATGCFALLLLLPLTALIVRFSLPEEPLDLLALLGGPLIASVVGAGLLLLLYGASVTVHQLSLSRLYTSATATKELENAVEVRGAASASPYFAAITATVILGAVAVAVAGVLLAVQVWPGIVLTAFVLALACLVAVLLLRAAGRRYARDVHGTLPALARGEQGPARMLVPDADKEMQRWVKARVKSETTPPDRVGTTFCYGLSLALLAVMAPSLDPMLPLWRLVQQVGIVLGILSLLGLLFVELLRLPLLSRTLARVRTDGAHSTARDRAHAIRATATRSQVVERCMGLWTLLGAAAVGSFVQHAYTPASVTAVAGIWMLGTAVFVISWMRTDAAGPKLREEFGYRLPTSSSSPNTST